MSRRAFRSVLAALALAGGLTLATPAEASEAAAREPGAWSLALRWLSGLWEEGPGRIWAAQEMGMDPEGSQAPPEPPPEATGDQGWGIDPNG